MSEENTGANPLSTEDAVARLTAGNSQEATPPKDEVAAEEQEAPAAAQSDNPSVEQEEVAPEGDEPPEEPEEKEEESEEEPAEEEPSEGDEEPSTDEEEEPETETHFTTQDGTEVTLDELKKGYLRQDNFTKQTQALAEERTVFGTDKEALQGERIATAEVLQYAMNVVDPVLVQGAQTDWKALLENDPMAYQESWAGYQQAQLQMQTLQSNAQQLVQANEQRKAAALAQYKQQQGQKLIEQMPDLGDSKKVAGLQQGMRNHALELGFTASDMENFLDHRLVVMLENSRKYTEHVVAGKKVAGKKLSKSPKKVVRPGKPATKAESSAAARKERFAKLNSSGSIADAAALLLGD